MPERPDPYASLRNSNFLWGLDLRAERQRDHAGHVCTASQARGSAYVTETALCLVGLSSSLGASATPLGPSSVVIRSTLLTLRTPERLLGRVSAVNSVILGGLLTLGVVGVTAWKIPALRELDQLDQIGQIGQIG